MTELEANHLKHINSNKLGLSKSNLYSPHVSVSKNMNKQATVTSTANHLSHTNNHEDESIYVTTKQTMFSDNNSEINATENDNNFDRDNLDEDIYDFSSVKHQMNLNENSAMINYTDEDEEDDINFDYEYGYDYERVIKDRLKKANQDFVNDSEPPKRKSVLVSFDNAVTAIDIPNETRPESSEIEPELNKISAQKKISFSATKSVHVDEEEPKKLPLNDTVQKEDPDAFANKIKQAVLRYDNEMKNQMEAEAQKSNGNEINEYFRDNFPDFSDSKESNEANREEISKNDYKDDEFEDEDSSKKEDLLVKKDSKNSSLSSSPVFNKSDTNRKSSTPSPSTPVDISTSPTIQTNPAALEPSLSPPSSETKIQDSTRSDCEKEKEEIVQEKKLSTNSKFNKESTVIASVEDNHQQIDESLKVPKQSIKKIPSFSASSKMNEASPSPIASFDSSPEPSKHLNQNNVIRKASSENILNNIQNNSKNVNSNESNEIQSSVSSSSEKQTNEDFIMDEKKNSEEKMLVEKDGIFKLMSPEEYTAYEKQKELERAKQSSKISMIPRPPPVRPKTSITTTGNRNAALKNRFISSSQQNQQLPARYSQSADPNGRRKDSIKNFPISINNRRTPDYAQDYKSPYQVQFKSIKPPIDLAEEKRRKEKEEEERRINNEMAFKAWLKLKEEQRIRDDKQKKKGNKNEDNSCSTAYSEDNKNNTYEYWLIRKREQMEAEKEFKKKLEEIEQQDRKTITPEERSKAFREWVSRKLKEKNEAIKLEKLESKKWIARRRRSRKHQRLSQALELAQAYGYNSSFYSPGFNF